MRGPNGDVYDLTRVVGGAGGQGGDRRPGARLGGGGGHPERTF